MKRFTFLLLVVLVAGAAGAAETAAKPTPNSRAVLPPVRRLDALKLAGQVLTPREITWKTSTVGLPDPFFRTNFVRDPDEKVPDAAPVVKKSERSDIEVLEMVSANFNPTGTMMVDGENYLLLGGKRYKTGAPLPVTLDGIVYPIVLSAIEGKSYTLRLNEQELRRQLK